MFTQYCNAVGLVFFSVYFLFFRKKRCFHLVIIIIIIIATDLCSIVFHLSQKPTTTTFSVNANYFSIVFFLFIFVKIFFLLLSRHMCKKFFCFWDVNVNWSGKMELLEKLFFLSIFIHRFFFQFFSNIHICSMRT